MAEMYQPSTPETAFLSGALATTYLANSDDDESSETSEENQTEGDECYGGDTDDCEVVEGGG